MGCVHGKPAVFKVLMANERGKYEISGYLCFKESSGDQTSSGRKNEPELILLNHWKEEISSDEKCYRWGVSQIRSYGYCGNVFMFDCARRSSRATLTSGETSTVVVSPAPQPKNLFQSDRAKDIFKLLQRICKRQAVKENKGFESTNWLKNREILTLQDFSNEAVRARNDVTQISPNVTKDQRPNLRQLNSSSVPQGHTLAYRGQPSVIRLSAGQSCKQNRSASDILSEPTHHLVSYGSYFGNSSPVISPPNSSAVNETRTSQSISHNHSAADRNNNVTSGTSIGARNYSHYSTIKARNERNELRINSSEETDKRLQCSPGYLYKNLKRRQSDFQGQHDSSQNMTSPSWHYMNPAVSPGKHRSSYHFDGSPAKISWNSSGISSAASNLGDDASIFFKFPEIEEPVMPTSGNAAMNSSNNFGKSYQEKLSLNCGSKNNSPGVVYSELDSSLGLGCSRSSTTGSANQIAVSCSSENSQQCRVPENAGKENSSLVSYSVLDVDRTRALASIGEDREMLNQWRNRRASSAACQNQMKNNLPGVQEKNVNRKNPKRPNSINQPSCRMENNNFPQTLREQRQTRHI